MQPQRKAELAVSGLVNSYTTELVTGMEGHFFFWIP